MTRSYIAQIQQPWCDRRRIEIRVSAASSDGARVAARDELRIAYRWPAGLSDTVGIELVEMGRA